MSKVDFLLYIFLSALVLLCLKVFLRCSAKGTYPIGGQFVKLGSRLDTVVRISDLGIVFVSAKLASVNSAHIKTSLINV